MEESTNIDKPKIPELEQPLQNSLLIDLDKKKTLKRLLEPYSSSQVSKIIKIMNEIYDEKKAEELNKAKEKSLSQSKLLKLLEQINESGLDVQNLSKQLQDNGIDNLLKNYKYEYTDSNGIKRYWSGKGKTPAEFAKILANEGKTKEDYLRK